MKAIPWLHRSSCILSTLMTTSSITRTTPPVSFAPPPRTLTTTGMSSSDDPPQPAAAGPRIDSVEPVASTKWLALQTLQWTDQDGQPRQWDMATRTTKQSHDKADAVVIIPLLRNKDNNNNNNGEVDTLLVEQYRPPVRRTTVEFPAGLIDANREETGYCRVPPIASRAICCMSPGLCDESVQVVIVEVDLRNPYNHVTPQPELDPGEHCVVKRISLQEGMKQILDQGTAMPIMGLYLFALGWELGALATTSLKKEA